MPSLHTSISRWGGAVALGLLVGCAAPVSDPNEDAWALELSKLDDSGAVAPVSSDSVADLASPIEAAKAAKDGGQFVLATQLYRSLSRVHPDPEKRAEFLFQAAESEFRRGDYHSAYQIYSRLLRLYPATPRFGDVVLQIFEIARLFAEGKADKPSWFFKVRTTDREFGIEILEKFQQARERHSHADDALYFMALAYFELGEREDAIGTWEKLIKEYPTSEWVETAHYRIGVTKLSTSDGPRYDKGPILAALAHLRDHVKRYPKGDHTAEASEAIRGIEEDLAQHWLEIAEYYMGQDEDYSATIYLAAIDREYPHTQAAKEAARLHDTIPKSSPPPAPPDPEGLEEHSVRDVERFHAAPPPDSSDLTPKPSH